MNTLLLTHNLDIFLEQFAFIIEGVPVALSLTLAGLGIGFMLGLPLSMARVYGGSTARLAVVAYERVTRSVPPLVLIFILYFGIPPSILEIDAFVAVALALGLCSSGYQSQIFRGALESVGTGQMDAARSLGMSRLQAIRWVTVPQAIRFALPGWSNELATMIKDTSIAFVVGIAELMRRADYIRAATYDPVLPFLVVATIYFIVVFPITRFAGTWGEAKRRLLTGA